MQSSLPIVVLFVVMSWYIIGCVIWIAVDEFALNDFFFYIQLNAKLKLWCQENLQFITCWQRENHWFKIAHGKNDFWWTLLFHLHQLSPSLDESTQAWRTNFIKTFVVWLILCFTSRNSFLKYLFIMCTFSSITI